MIGGEEVGARNVVVTVPTSTRMPTGVTAGIFTVSPDARSWILRITTMQVARVIADRP